VVREFLSGRLLVATPRVGDDVFRRSVVLVLHHDEDGAQGVILNRPLDADVDAVLPGWGNVVTSPQTLFQGGPVGLDSAVGVVTVPGDDTSTLGVRRLFGRVGLVDLDAPPPVVAAAPVFVQPAPVWVQPAPVVVQPAPVWVQPAPVVYRAPRVDWIVVDSEPRDPFTAAPESLWEQVLRRQGGMLQLVASYPDDPSMN
jgi:putative transcriptional regulator